MKNKKAFSMIEMAIVVMAIAAFIAGVTQSSRLVSSMRLTVARSISSSSAVPGIKNLYAWWDSTADYSFLDREAEDSKAISAWYDRNPQNAYSHNIFQTNPSKKPSYVRVGINKLPAVEFDGEDFLKTLVDPKVLLANGAATVFMVFEAYDAATQRFLLMQPIANCLENIEIGHSLEVIPNSFGVHSGCGYATSSPKDTVIDNIPLLTTMVFFQGPIVTKDTSNIAIYKNGNISKLVLEAEGGGGFNSGLNGKYPKGSAPIIMGARDSDNVNNYDAYFKGKIGEIIIYDRVLRDKERLEVQEYLTRKWAIEDI